ncbi:Acryloyl-CoA reductase (NADH) [Brevundimonas sp. SH203]|uniref:acyl-CoA dehydrogenase family protein n=1 Tax=Brevundimonas sp. SH203 TaxID=345167 RepID=UPI0009CE5EA1|nr:acyl-CoA dehydrogenase family protein [Brevundimonas sp. SH203]GAW40301.1 Acryloyl-CoA reductase (NADH) [Brevundimonas sp. SH203]
MQYHLSEEQGQIRDVITAYLRDRYDHDSRLKIVSSPERWSPTVWNDFAHELGILGLGLPEWADGLGGGAVDHMLVMDALGSALVVEPYLETCVLGAAVLMRAEGDVARHLLAGIVAGEVRLAIADLEDGPMSPTVPFTSAARVEGGWRLRGVKSRVTGLPGATHILVTARAGDEGDMAVFLLAADHPGVALVSGPTIDGRVSSEVRFENISLSADACLIGGGRGAEVFAEAVDRATAALCGEAVGIMRRLIADTLAYLEQRRQFGAFLADFQVLQHRLADMQVEYEHAQAMAFFAAGMADAEPERRRPAVAASKARISRALRHVAQEAVQMHGAMGMTDELAIGHLFRRATVLENQYGSIDRHMKAVVKAGSDTAGWAAD